MSQREKLEIYRYVDYRGKKAFLFCMGGNQTHTKYQNVRYYDTYAVLDYWISTPDPIEFIAGQCKALNSLTSTGITEIKRVKYKSLPKLVKSLFETN